MRGAILAFAALLLTAAGTQAQDSGKAPTCRADRRGEDLVTRIEFPDGYTVEGPWHVTGQGPNTGNVTLLTAVLDRIIETQPVSHKKQTTALPSTIEMTFRGSSFDDVLLRAANMWCLTVLQARPTWQGDVKPVETLGQVKITP